MRVQYRRRAQLDIENIHEYIDKRNPRAATEVVGRIRDAADRLGVLPYMGHVGRARETYEWVVVGSPFSAGHLRCCSVASSVAILRAMEHGNDRNLISCVVNFVHDDEVDDAAD